MQIHTFKSPTELSEAAADWIVSLIQNRLTIGDRFCLLLSGGNTPKQLYQLLASDPYRNKIDWKKLHIFFGDERVVPFDDERNNGKMAYDTLLSKVPIPAEQIHYIDTKKLPEQSAEDYEILLRQYFDTKEGSFDLSLLGMGDDGHTLSVFPGYESTVPKEKWVFSLYLSSQQMHRISLTPGIVNKSKNVAFLVTGVKKAPILKKIFKAQDSSISFPAELIHPANGELHWFVDEEAYRL